MPPRIVIDTNVLAGALISDSGTNREVLRRSLLGEYKPLISNALFLEYEDVTTRGDILELCPATAGEIQDLVDALCSVCEWISIYYLWRPNLSDEGDNHVLELAIGGNAETVVTNNVRDFRTSQLRFPEISIMTPGELLGDN
jgi:putative PIN family toxin of toxin-antitoxin system